MTTWPTSRQGSCIVMRSVAFASCYVYSPTGECVMSRRSRLMRALLKDGDMQYILKYALRVHERVLGSRVFEGIFDPVAVLIPVPGCSPVINGESSVAERLATALLREGLGGEIWPGLRRARAVRKSATCPRGARPTVGNHYTSLSVGETIRRPQRILLVDDVITKGRTLLAAATRLREVFPDAQIQSFALLRTMGFIPDVCRLVDPCRGVITWKAGDARRNP